MGGGHGKLWPVFHPRTAFAFAGGTAVEQAQKEEIERHLHSARKVMHDALQQCRTEKINPAAVAQVLGENAVMLMIRNFGPDAGKQFGKNLAEEAVRMAHYYKTQATKPAE
jgi:delta 1-pyrroline-5-carboxylate dehydrogenase